jgi:predicted component of type VI protein secretion system
MPVVNDLERYGQDKAKEIQQRRERRKIEIEKASADNRLKAQWAPKLWQSVRETIAERVQAVNIALGEPALTCDAARPDWVIIRVNQVFTNVAAAYDPGTGKVTLNLEDHSETYELEVSKGEVRYKEIGSFTPDQVARMLVDKAASLVL